MPDRRGVMPWVVALSAALGIGTGLASGWTPARAADDLERQVGSPASVAILPAEPKLVGRRATGQLIATATDPDGSQRDLTRALEWVSLDPNVAVVSPKGRVEPRGNGVAAIVARRGSVEVRTSVKVEAMEKPAPVSFRRDVIPAFSQAGCNMGACHGTPTGKGGFRLSLRGYLPDQDYFTLTREAGGPPDQPARRRHQPDSSEAAGTGPA